MELEEVIRALAPRLLAYVSARTGNRALAEDVAQDALLALVQTWRRRGPPDSPAAFAFAIAKRRAWRALARRAVLAPLAALRGARDGAVTADYVLEHREQADAVLRAINDLPRRDREVLLLSATGELRIADIAMVTGATPAAVKTRLSRARKRLAAIQEEMSYDRARALK